MDVKIVLTVSLICLRLNSFCASIQFFCIFETWKGKWERHRTDFSKQVHDICNLDVLSTQSQRLLYMLKFCELFLKLDSTDRQSIAKIIPRCSTICTHTCTDSGIKGWEAVFSLASLAATQNTKPVSFLLSASPNRDCANNYSFNLM